MATRGRPTGSPDCPRLKPAPKHIAQRLVLLPPLAVWLVGWLQNAEYWWTGYRILVNWLQNTGGLVTEYGILVDLLQNTEY